MGTERFIHEKCRNGDEGDKSGVRGSEHVPVSPALGSEVRQIPRVC